MAFGLLGSIIPQINRNEVLYASLNNKLSIGKVSISNKNYNPSKIRIGITTDDINVEYLEYNRFVNYGETFETETLYLGHGQKIIARSNISNVNFLFYGEDKNDTFNPVKSGFFNSILSTNATKKVLYVGPQNYDAYVTLSVCNLNSLPSKIRIGISNADLNAFDSSEYIEYDIEIGPNQTYTRTEIKLNELQSLVCSSSENSNVNFICYGYLQLINDSGEFVIDASNQNITFSTINASRSVVSQLNVTGIATVNNFNNTGIGTANRFNVTGLNVTGLNVTGIATVNNFNNTGIGTISILNFNQISGQIGTHIIGFSTDNTLSQNSNQRVPTEAATRYYIDNSTGISSSNSKIYTYFLGLS